MVAAAGGVDTRWGPPSPDLRGQSRRSLRGSRFTHCLIASARRDDTHFPGPLLEIQAIQQHAAQYRYGAVHRWDPGKSV